MESEMKDELISRIDRMEKCLKTYPSYKAITSKLDGILGKEQDKFEEWIKTWIKGISNSPARSHKDHKVATMKMDMLYSCLLKYRELKEKGEI